MSRAAVPIGGRRLGSAHGRGVDYVAVTATAALEPQARHRLYLVCGVPKQGMRPPAL
jgi:hypothetical protein